MDFKKAGTSINNFFAALFPKGNIGGTPNGHAPGGPVNFGLGLGAGGNRGAGTESKNETQNPGAIVLAGAESAWNAHAQLILTGQQTIEDVPEEFRSEVQERVDNPAPSVLRNVEAYQAANPDTTDAVEGEGILDGILDGVLDSVTGGSGPGTNPRQNPGSDEVFQQSDYVIDEVSNPADVITEGGSEAGGGGSDASADSGGQTSGETGAGGDTPSADEIADYEAATGDVVDTGGEMTISESEGNATLIGQLDEAIAAESDPATKADLQQQRDNLAGAEPSEDIALGDDPVTGSETAGAGGEDKEIEIDFGIDLSGEDDDDSVVPSSTTTDDAVLASANTGDLDVAAIEGETVEGDSVNDTGAGEGLSGDAGSGAGAGTGTDGVEADETGEGTGEGEGSGDGAGAGNDGLGEDEESNPLIAPPQKYEPEEPAFSIRGYFGFAKNNVEDQHRRNPWTYRRNL